MKIHEVKMSLEHSPGRRLLRPKQVMVRMGWSRTTLWRRVRAGEFPAPFKTGTNCIAWFDDEVDEAQANLLRVNYAPTLGTDDVVSHQPGANIARP